MTGHFRFNMTHALVRPPHDLQDFSRRHRQAVATGLPRQMLDPCLSLTDREDRKLLPRAHIPDSPHPIFSSRAQEPTFGMPSHRQDGSPMPCCTRGETPKRNIPHDDLPARITNRQLPPVRRKLHVVDVIIQLKGPDR